jgi:hypothetical protein
LLQLIRQFQLEQNLQSSPMVLRPLRRLHLQRQLLLHQLLHRLQRQLLLHQLLHRLQRQLLLHLQHLPEP